MPCSVISVNSAKDIALESREMKNWLWKHKNTQSQSWCNKYTSTFRSKSQLQVEQLGPRQFFGSQQLTVRSTMMLTFRS